MADADTEPKGDEGLAVGMSGDEQQPPVISRRRKNRQDRAQYTVMMMDMLEADTKLMLGGDVSSPGGVDGFDMEELDSPDELGLGLERLMEDEPDTKNTTLRKSLKQPLPNSCPKFQQKRSLHSLAAFFFGWFYALLFFLFAYFMFLPDLPLHSNTLLHVSIHSACVVGLLLSAGCVKWRRFRCVLAVSLPELFTNRGRSVMFSVLTGLLISGPLANMVYNTAQIHSAYECGMDRIKAAAAEQRDQLKLLQSAMTNLSRDLLEEARQLHGRLRDAKERVDKMIAATRPVVEAYDNVRCFFGFVDCSRLNFTNPLDVGHLKLAGKFNRSAVALLKMKFTKGGAEDIVKVDDVDKGEFIFVKDKLENLLREVLRNADLVGVILNKLFLLSIIHIYFRSHEYVFRYLCEDSFDNRLVDASLRSLWQMADEEDKDENDVKDRQMSTLTRKEKIRRMQSRRRDSVLPLRRWELKYFRPRSTYRLTRGELISAMLSIFAPLLALLLVALFCLADNTLYQALDFLQLHGNVTLKVVLPDESVPGAVRISQGSLLKGLNFTTETCLPKPRKPDVNKYSVMFVIVAACLLTGFIQAYVRRLRPMICNWFYLKREIRRSKTLYWSIEQGRIRRGFRFENVVRERHRLWQRQKEAMLCPTLWCRTSVTCPEAKRRCPGCNTLLSVNNEEEVWQPYAIGDSQDDPNIMICSDCFKDYRHGTQLHFMVEYYKKHSNEVLEFPSLRPL